MCWTLWAGPAKVLAGDMTTGIANLESSVSTNPTVAAYFHLAKAKIKGGQKEGVYEICEAGIQLAIVRNDPLIADLRALQAEAPQPASATRKSSAMGGSNPP